MKQSKKAESFTHFQIWKYPAKKHLCSFAKPQTGCPMAPVSSPQSCLPAATLRYHHSDLLTFSSNKPRLSQILWAFEHRNPPPGGSSLLLRKQLLIFQRSSNVTPSAHPPRQKKVDCGIYHSAWHSSVFISISFTGLYVTKTKTVPHSF